MFQLRFQPQQGHFLVHLVGLVSLPAWEAGLRELREALEGQPGDRLVVDLTGLVGFLGVPERTAVGNLMAVHLKRMKRVAIHVQAEKIAGVVEAQAQRQGLDLRVFPSHEQALAWVLS
ncbi:hypothetical protein ACFPOE_22315 [Caenimonas terrae]|uniref:STAS/SEC14 domain-containing protein n=1 Tax=Caenimonas terrae TaxID=696074 RepID=A0ABW0NIS1_9BURK